MPPEEDKSGDSLTLFAALADGSRNRLVWKRH